MPFAGEQRGVSFDGPRQFLLIGAPATGSDDCCRDRVPVDLGIEPGDNGVDHRYRTTVVDVATLSASWLSVAVDDLHTFGFAAARAGSPAVFAGAAIPVLALAGEGLQMFAAGGAARR